MDLRTFESFGFISIGNSGNQEFGSCPFCNSKKFYINTDAFVWDCKVCGRYGNDAQFLQQIMQFYKEQTTDAEYIELSLERKIPASTLDINGLANSPFGWLIPVYDGLEICDIKRYQLGDKLKSTPGCKVGLFNSQSVEPDELVYLCEGEWDCMALQSILSGYDGEHYGIPVGVPGAETFKRNWIPLLDGKDIIALYDNDTPGKKGIQRVRGYLQSANFRNLIWAEGLPEKYDIRDLCNTLEYKSDEVLNFIWTHLDVIEVEENTEPCSIRDVIAEFRQWLLLTDEMVDALKCILSVVISNRLNGDPLWMYIVAPPGGSKTELLNTLSASKECVIRSTITAQGLISGFQGAGGTDPSLLPRLTNKTLVIKDFTELRSLHRDTRAEVYAVLRGAYDGYVERSYGNGVTRRYNNTHFSILAGVTQSIHGDTDATLGERFLKFQMMRGVGFDAGDTIRKALSNVTYEKEMRESLASVCDRFLKNRFEADSLPEMNQKQIERLVALSQFVSMLRGNVERDTKDRIIYRPQHEVGTRIAKQLKKLAVSLAYIHKEKKVSDSNYGLVEQVALDSCIGLALEVFGVLNENANGMSLQELSDFLKIPFDSLNNRLQDLEMLGVIQLKKHKAGRGRPSHRYYVSDRAAELWGTAGITSELKWIISKSAD